MSADRSVALELAGIGAAARRVRRDVPRSPAVRRLRARGPGRRAHRRQRRTQPAHLDACAHASIHTARVARGGRHSRSRRSRSPFSRSPPCSPPARAGLPSPTASATGTCWPRLRCISRGPCCSNTSSSSTGSAAGCSSCRRGPRVAVTALAFSAVHFPRWPVMAVTLVAGAVWSLIYLPLAHVAAARDIARDFSARHCTTGCSATTCSSAGCRSISAARHALVTALANLLRGINT